MADVMARYPEPGVPRGRVARVGRHDGGAELDAAGPQPPKHDGGEGVKAAAGEVRQPEAIKAGVFSVDHMLDYRVDIRRPPRGRAGEESETHKAPPIREAVYSTRAMRWAKGLLKPTRRLAWLKTSYGDEVDVTASG